jgi:hypothetical protein
VFEGNYLHVDSGHGSAWEHCVATLRHSKGDRGRDIKTDEQILFSQQAGSFFSVALGAPVGTLDGFFPNGVGDAADWGQETEGYASSRPTSTPSPNRSN